MTASGTSKTDKSNDGNNHGICYFNHGTKHLVRLIVSLRSLENLQRNSSDGVKSLPPIAILHTQDTWNEQAARIVREIPAAFPGLSIRLIEVPLCEHNRHSCYVTKATLWRYSPFDVTVLLDADTLVVGGFAELFEWAADPKGPGIVVARFSRWHTQGNIVSGRVKQWRDKRVRCANANVNAQELVRRALEYPWPALNTGVLAWRKDAEILPVWEDLTRAGWRCSFTDELAMQLLITKYQHVLVGDEFNWSPIYGKAGRDGDKSRVRIVHFHGNKQLRDEAKGWWLPVYEECVEENVAGVRDWTPGGDKRLGLYLGQAS